MAQFQTRKSISISGALFRRVREFAGERISLAQLTEQALEAVLDGRLELAPPLPRSERMPRLDAGVPVARRELPRPVLDRRLKPFCASCTGPTILDPGDPRCATLQPLGAGGGLVTICHDCNELPSSDPRYDIGNVASARPGLREGGKRVGGNGAGR